MPNRLYEYALLMRLDKPVGALLLLWPTLWALWLAGAGEPQPYILAVFVTGVFLMRSAGCVINDIADRNLDGHVARTNARPLPAGVVETRQALLLFALLVALAAWQRRPREAAPTGPVPVFTTEAPTRDQIASVALWPQRLHQQKTPRPSVPSSPKVAAARRRSADSIARCLILAMRACPCRWIRT